MARKKKKKDMLGFLAGSPQQGSSRRRVSSSVESAENGFIVHVDSEGGDDGGYGHKTYVASKHPEAIQIAHNHIATIANKSGKGKKSKSKKYSIGKR